MSLTAFVVRLEPPSDEQIAGDAAVTAFLEKLSEQPAFHVTVGTARIDFSSVYLDENEGAIAKGVDPRDPKISRTLVFDGWLENRDELVAELSTDGATAQSSDSSLVLKSIGRWGEEAVHRLYGEYSFVCISLNVGSKTPAVFAVRDKVGIRPLFYSNECGKLALSNFPGALSVIPWIGSEINEGYAAEYLCAEINSVRETHFVRVRRLLGGHSLGAVRPSVQIIQRYWLPSDQVDRRPHDEIRADFRRVLNLATISACRVARPSTLMVSGGIDSSCLAVVIADAIDEGTLSRDQFFASNLTYPGLACDESQYREALAEVLPYEMKVFTPRYATSADITARTARLRYPFGTFPGTSGDVVAEHLVRLGGRVIIKGEGGDELLLPQAAAFSRALVDLNEANAAKRLLINRWSTRPRNASTLGKIRHAIDPMLSWNIQNVLSRMRNRKRSGWQSAVDVNWTDRVELVNRLDRLLPHSSSRTQQAAIATSGLGSLTAETAYAMNFLRKTETRNPLLSARTVGFCNTLPLGLLDGQTLGLSRQLLRSIVSPRLPSLIAERSGKAEFSESVLPALEAAAGEQFGAYWREPALAFSGRSTLSANESKHVWRLDALHAWRVLAIACRN